MWIEQQFLLDFILSFVGTLPSAAQQQHWPAILPMSKLVYRTLGKYSTTQLTD